MNEYWIAANSFAAPFVSDASTKFVSADSPEAALEAFAATYRHPAGLYSAVCYADANAYHKGAKPLAIWLCNHEQRKQLAAADKGGYSYISHGPGDFTLDGTRYLVDDPKSGSVVR